MVITVCQMSAWVALTEEHSMWLCEWNLWTEFTGKGPSNVWRLSQLTMTDGSSVCILPRVLHGEMAQGQISKLPLTLPLLLCCLLVMLPVCPLTFFSKHTL